VSQYVTSLEVIGLYERFDIEQKFNAGINVLFGKNGACKTTLLHILANVLNGDYRRFLHLDFQRITLTLDDNETVIIEWIPENGEKILNIRHSKTRRGIKIHKQDSTFSSSIPIYPVLTLAYFPAFRTMIEAWSSLDDTDITKHEIVRETLQQYTNSLNLKQEATTLFVRKLFGDFVPEINYPSPQEIELSLANEAQEAILEIARADREIFSQSFVDTFSALSPIEDDSDEQPEKILERIKVFSEELQNYPFQDESMLSSGIYSRVQEILSSMAFRGDGTKSLAARILKVYRDSLERIVNAQKNAFSSIEQYLQAVSEFLEDKNLVVKNQQSSPLQPFVQISFRDGSSSDGLSSLSSGERQIVTLIYAVTHMSPQDVVLIDEPEISLHIDWQRKLLTKMAAQLTTQQVIVCTHSPSIGRDHSENFQRIALNPTDKSKWMVGEKEDKRQHEQTNTSVSPQDEAYTDDEPVDEEDLDFEED